MMERVTEGARNDRFSADLGLVRTRAIIDFSNIEPDERIDIQVFSHKKAVMS